MGAYNIFFIYVPHFDLKHFTPLGQLTHQLLLIITDVNRFVKTVGYENIFESPFEKHWNFEHRRYLG